MVNTEKIFGSSDGCAADAASFSAVASCFGDRPTDALPGCFYLLILLKAKTSVCLLFLNRISLVVSSRFPFKSQHSMRLRRMKWAQNLKLHDIWFPVDQCRFIRVCIGWCWNLARSKMERLYSETIRKRLRATLQKSKMYQT